MRLALAPLVVLAAIACSGNRSAEGADSVSTPVPAAAADTSSVPVVTLERTPCFGTCPVYQLSIFGDGTVRFAGKLHVATQGMATAKISPAAVDSLVVELESAGYFEFADAYVLDAPACGQYATDSPTVTTSLTVKGRTKQVRHDYGCSAAPPELRRLEQRIDEVAGTSRWIGR
jgi:Domain of unknown function (DUF6438)